MRILMMGTGGFAVPTFRWLLQSDHDVPALITRPAAGRRDKRSRITNPMREVADEHRLTVYDPPSINSPQAIDRLREIAPDLMVVCDYGQILSSEALAVAPRGGINLHGSLLPKYRGAAPVNWALYHGERETGVTVIHMTPELDAGPSLGVARVEIGREETAAALEARLAILGVGPVSDAIKMLEAWDGVSPMGIRQDQALATKAPRLKKSDGLIDWTRSAEQLYCQIRALKPWPGTYTYFERPSRPAMRLLIDWAEPLALDEMSSTIHEQPGIVIADPNHSLIVATGVGALRLVRVQPEGKKRLEAADFVHGYRVVAGTPFCTNPLAQS